MSHHFRRACVLLAVLAAGLVAVPTALADNTLFSGRAAAVDGKVAGIPVALADTGEVSASGGTLEANLVCYPLGPNCVLGAPDLTNGLIEATVLHAAVVAQGQQSSAESFVASFSLNNVAGNNVSATALDTSATASCQNGNPSVSGTFQILTLTINGQTITVGPVNQTVPLPGGGFVIVNEQIASVQANKGDITVNALHIVIPEQKVDGIVTVPGTDLVVAHAHADILCAGNPGACPGARVTGGGWFYWPASPNRVHFALAAKDGLSSWGHLLYMDKAMDIKAKGTPLSATIVPTPNSKNDGSGSVEGTASADKQINGQSVGYFVVEFQDNGEPGKGDRFGIQLLTQKSGTLLYEANFSLGLTLNGGNEQVHACK